jgi:hypothetical protein
VTAYSYTDWHVCCDKEGCGHRAGSGDIPWTGGSTPTATEIRRVLRQRGWQVGVLCGPADDDETGSRRHPRRDFCPDHKLEPDETAAVTAGEEHAHGPAD